MTSHSRLSVLVLFSLAIFGLAPAQTPALTNADVLKMVQAGLSEAVVVETIKNASSTAFDVSPDALVALKNAGVGDAILTQMVTRPNASKSESSEIQRVPPVTTSTGRSVQRGAILRGVKAVKVQPTVISNPDKVNEDFAANLVEQALRNALQDSNFEVAEEAQIRAHIVLDEFSSGSTARRLLVGFGSGRSTVDGRLVFQDSDGRELGNVRIRVRGNLLFGAYQGGTTQRRQAVGSFDHKLREEIARLK